MFFCFIWLIFTGYIEFGPDITQKQQGTKLILSSEDEVKQVENRVFALITPESGTL